MTVIDVSGADSGGAACFRREAERWVATHPANSVRLIGVGRGVTARWLVQRETIGRNERRVSANNVSFVGGHSRRIVLLRNALHFLRQSERALEVPKRVRYQTPIIHRAALRADVVVVPSSDMADRVVSVLPQLSQRLTMRHHPLSATPHRRGATGPSYVLYPSIPSAHKDLRSGISSLATAVEQIDMPVVIKVTASFSDLGEVADHPQVEPIGRQPLAAMDELWAGASAAFVPYTVESFGYPLAEARAIGIPVIAVENAHNREIAGEALVGYDEYRSSSLTEAVRVALDTPNIDPDPGPFDPSSYFSWLTAI